ncbi:MAG: response regulator [Thermoguttaceae bacterium]|nr:response regulator [Thermoguttaceae bacterium]
MAEQGFGEPLRLLLIEDYAPMFGLLRDDLLEYATFPIEVVGADSLTLAENLLRQTIVPASSLGNHFKNHSSPAPPLSDTSCQPVFPDTRYAIDLVMSDLTLPDSRGVATVERLRRAAGHRPILILTSWDDGVLFKQCEAAGANVCRAKGRTDGRELIALIRQLFTTSALAPSGLATV